MIYFCTLQEKGFIGRFIYNDALQRLLCSAIENKKDFIALALLDIRKVQIHAHAKDNKALRRAARYGSLNVVNRLLEFDNVKKRADDKEDNFANTALEDAMDENHFIIVKRLLQEPRVRKYYVFYNVMRAFIQQKAQKNPIMLDELLAIESAQEEITPIIQKTIFNLIYDALQYKNYNEFHALVGKGFIERYVNNSDLPTLLDTALYQNDDIALGLLNIPKVFHNAHLYENFVLRAAVRLGNSVVIDRLLELDNVREIAHAGKIESYGTEGIDDSALTIALDHNYASIVKKLLRIPTITNAENFNAIILKFMSIDKIPSNVITLSHLIILETLLTRDTLSEALREKLLAFRLAMVSSPYILTSSIIDKTHRLTSHLLNIPEIQQNAHAENNSALRYALKNNHTDIAKKLLTYENVRSNAHQEGENETQLFWLAEKNPSALFFAIKHDNIEIIKELLGIPVVVRTQTPMIIDYLKKLSYYHNYDLIEQLLSIPAVQKIVERHEDLATLLSITQFFQKISTAITTNDINTLKNIIAIMKSRGLAAHLADDDNGNKNNTALRLAIKKNNIEIIKELLDIVVVAHTGTPIIIDYLKKLNNNENYNLLEQLYSIPAVQTIIKQHKDVEKLLHFTTYSAQISTAIANNDIKGFKNIIAIVKGKGLEKHLVDDPNGNRNNTALLFAIKNNNIEIIKELLDIVVVAHTGTPIIIDYLKKLNNDKNYNLLEQLYSVPAVQGIIKQYQSLEKLLHFTTYSVQISTAIANKDIKAFKDIIAIVNEKGLDKYLADDHDILLKVIRSKFSSNDMHTAVMLLLDNKKVRELEGITSSKWYNRAENEAHVHKKHDIAKLIHTAVADLTRTFQPEGVSTALITPEQETLKELLDMKYEATVRRKGVNNIINDIKEYLHDKCERHLIIVDGKALSVDHYPGPTAGMPGYEDNIRRNKKVFTAYHKNNWHTSNRYFLDPNYWMSANAKYTKGDPSIGTGYVDLGEQLLELIALIWCAFDDPDLPIPDKYKRPDKSEEQIREDLKEMFALSFADFNRSHNLDKYEDRDDDEGDKPSCAPGIRKRMMDILQERMNIEIISAENIKNQFAAHVIDDVIERSSGHDINLLAGILTKMTIDDTLTDSEQATLKKLFSKLDINKFKTTCKNRYMTPKNQNPLAKAVNIDRMKFKTYEAYIDHLAKNLLSIFPGYLHERIEIHPANAVRNKIHNAFAIAANTVISRLKDEDVNFLNNLIRKITLDKPIESEDKEFLNDFLPKLLQQIQKYLFPSLNKKNLPYTI